MSKRVVILGAGESGTGAAILAKEKGFEVFVSDQGSIKDRYKDDLLRSKIDFEEGTHTEEHILSAGLVIKSPGIPDKAPIVGKLREKEIEIIDEIEFGFRYLTGKVIAITGTNGKTTTTLLTYHLLKSAGFDVVLGGNVGESLARKVAHGNHQWYVLETSSFQLDGTRTFRPDIGILLNITPDHLDRYHYQMQEYVNAKFRLVQNMDAQDHFIYYNDESVITTEVSKRRIAANPVSISLNPESSTPAYARGSEMHFALQEEFSIRQEDTTLKGPHNLINTMAAVSAARLAGVSVKALREGLKAFKNAPHRLETITTINGIEFVNDSKATNVDSVVYALGSYTQPLVWVAGGIDKGNDYNLIKTQVSEKVKALICLGADNAKLRNFFSDVVPVIRETQDVTEVIRLALELGKPGDVVLLSPACASFDLFKNYEDRGNQFRAAVLDVKRKTENQPV